MRITVSHHKTKEQVIKAVDQGIDDAFRSLASGPVTLTNPQKSWNGSVMTFSLSAKVGFMNNPISGTVEVTDKDVTIDADLGMLSRLFPVEKFRSSLETRVRGLLT